MPTKLAKFDFTEPSNLTSSDKATYPWEEWFDGDIWQIEHGEDFQPHPLMMERIIRTRATGRKARIRLRHLPLNGTDPFGIIVFQRTDVQGPTATKKAEAAAKRAAKAAEAQKAAAETLQKAGIKPKAAKTSAKNGAPAKRSKRPAKAVA